MKAKFRLLPEVIIAGAALAVLDVFALAFRLPIMFPSPARAQFLGIHYIYPVLGAALLGTVMFVCGKRNETRRLFVALPCYIVVLFVHFNLKLWIPHINPLLFDSLFWQIDQQFRWLIDLCMAIRMQLWPVLPPDANAYVLIFIFMFYISYAYHSVRTPAHIGKVIVAVLAMQVLGALAYLGMPAIGPFIYERGVNPINTRAQLEMLDVFRHSVLNGPEWLAANGGSNFTSGLAAMPSLHNAGALLFLLFAWKYGKPLVPAFALAFAFIVITSIASRWHYLADLPIGWLLGWVSFRIGERFGDAPSAMTVTANVEPHPLLPGFAELPVSHSSQQRFGQPFAELRPLQRVKIRLDQFGFHRRKPAVFQPHHVDPRIDRRRGEG